MQQQKNLRSLKIVVLTGASIGVGIAVALSVIAGCVHWLESRPKPWRQDAISAAFSGFLSEREHPRFVGFEFTLTNHTRLDYKLDAPSASGTARDPVVIEFGELYGGSIRFPARGKLVYPIFVPANQKAEVVVTFEPRNAKGIADILKSEDAFSGSRPTPLQPNPPFVAPRVRVTRGERVGSTSVYA